MKKIGVVFTCLLLVATMLTSCKTNTNNPSESPTDKEFEYVEPTEKPKDELPNIKFDKDDKTVYVLEAGRMNDTDATAAVALQGIVNRYGPNIFIIPGNGRSVWSQIKTQKKRLVEDAFAKEKLDEFPNVEEYWMDHFTKEYGFKFEKIKIDQAFEIFKPALKGVVLYDEKVAKPIAFTMAGVLDAIPMTSKVLEKHDPLKDLDVLYNTEGQFKDKYEAHEWAINEFLDKTTKDFASSMFSEPEGATVQNDYAVMNKAFTFQLNFLSKDNLNHATDDEKKTYDRNAEPLVDKIFEHLNPYSFIWGWGEGGENAIASRCAMKGMSLLCANTPNGSFLAAVEPKNVEVSKQNEVNKDDVQVENKMYIAFMTNEGDTYKYAYSMGNFAAWQEDARGSLPVNWGVDPLVFDLFPSIRDFYYSSKSENDYFFAATSGYGYLHPNFLNPDYAMGYADMVGFKLQKYNLRYIDIWWMNGMKDKDGKDISWEWYKKIKADGLTFWDGRNNTTFEAGPVINSQLYYPLEEITSKSNPDNACNVLAQVLIDAQKKLDQNKPFLCVFYGGDPASFAKVLKQLPEDKFEAVTLSKLFAIAEKVGEPLTSNKAQYNITTDATANFSPMR